LILKENKYNQLNLELSVGNHYISLSAKDHNSDEIVIHKRKNWQTATGACCRQYY